MARGRPAAGPMPAAGVYARAGAVAGLWSGAVLGLVMLRQGMMEAQAPGPGNRLIGFGVVVLVGGATGAILGAVCRPESVAAGVSGGLLFGLLAWIAWSLTILPLLRGSGPTWSVAAAGESFPFLVGGLLRGGLTGLLLPGLAGRFTPTAPAPVPAPRRHRVVIVGGGFGGVAAAQRFEQLVTRGLPVDVTLVSQSNYLLFTPMLAEVASSALEAQHISAAVRAACPLTEVRRAALDAIDPARGVVTASSGPGLAAAELPYDHLVLALGAVPHFFDLPGLEKHSLTLKSLGDATRLRDHVLAMLERADVEADPDARRILLSFVVAGGGFAGTEMIAELFDLVHGVLRYYPGIGRHEPRFVLVHSRDRILPELPAELAAYALGKLRARGIEFALSRRVQGAREGAVLLDGDEALPTMTLVWTAGNRPNPALARFPAEKNRSGALLVEPTLRVRGHERVWALGDCAEIPDPDRDGTPYPPTAQHALREGRAAADNIAAVIGGREPAPFRFRTIGILVALGHRTAVAEIRGRHFSGLAAWLLWRTVYLGKLPGLEKKLRVALDWTIELAFPRDIVVTAAPPRERPVTSGGGER
ncbi:MAG: NAD(P)/FAD-dependent oxidoreductase [Acidimicrobiales bacterium]